MRGRTRRCCSNNVCRQLETKPAFLFHACFSHANHHNMATIMPHGMVEPVLPPNLQCGLRRYNMMCIAPELRWYGAPIATCRALCLATLQNTVCCMEVLHGWQWYRRPLAHIHPQVAALVLCCTAAVQPPGASTLRKCWTMSFPPINRRHPHLSTTGIHTHAKASATVIKNCHPHSAKSGCDFWCDFSIGLMSPVRYLLSHAFRTRDHITGQHCQPPSSRA
jgi:hypothetical protein